MATLCPRGKAAAKAKFKVYPSAYANMYASAVCSGKIVPGGRKKKMGGGSVSQGLRKWVQDNWVDIANKKSDGSYPKCGRSGGETRKNYPKCVPIAKARSMSKGQRASAVKRKQQAGNTGPKPANVPTILKRKKMGIGGLV
jgi:hypothetical protein